MTPPRDRSRIMVSDLGARQVFNRPAATARGRSSRRHRTGARSSPHTARPTLSPNRPLPGDSEDPYRDRAGERSPHSCPDQTFSLEESSTGRGPFPGRRRERTVQRTADPSAQPAETRSSSKPPVTRIGQLRSELKGYRLRAGACSMTARP